ncbi:MAG: ketopantoate reductase family protein [Paracoccaceae bacterium]
MRLGIVGLGGIGGHLAARLAAAGASVSGIARGRHLAAIRERGLTLVTPHDRVHATIEAAEDAHALGPVDVAVFAVKGQDLDTAMDAALPWMEGGALALPMLNGVEATERLAARFGAERALIGIARVSAAIEEPGTVRQYTDGARYTIATADGHQDRAPVPALHALFAEAGIDTAETRDARTDLWRKFAGLAAFAGTTAGARVDGPTVAATPALADLYRAIAGEVAALAAAEGFALEDDLAERGLGFCASVAPGTRASMAYDLAHAKPLELDWLNGAVPRLAARHGLAAPANAAVAALLAPYREGARG